MLKSALEQTGGATGPSKADAPEIDGEVRLRDSEDIVPAKVEDSDAHDVYGVALS